MYVYYVWSFEKTTSKFTGGVLTQTLGVHTSYDADVLVEFHNRMHNDHDLEEKLIISNEVATETDLHIHSKHRVDYKVSLIVVIDFPNDVGDYHRRHDLIGRDREKTLHAHVIHIAF